MSPGKFSADVTETHEVGFPYGFLPLETARCYTEVNCQQSVLNIPTQSVSRFVLMEKLVPAFCAFVLRIYDRELTEQATASCGVTCTQFEIQVRELWRAYAFVYLCTHRCGMWQSSDSDLQVLFSKVYIV